MTEDERTRLIQQINMGANLSNHQMGAVMGALTHLGWQPPKQESEMNKNSDLMSTAPLPNYSAQIDTPARCEPPEGIRDDTYCVLHGSSGGAQVAARWTSKKWQFVGDNNPYSPEDTAFLGWRYSHAVPIDPPVVDPHAELRDEVVEAAMCLRDRWDSERVALGRPEVGRVAASVDRLRAAMSPPDPASELEDAWDNAERSMSNDDCDRMDAAVKAAIAALRKGAEA